MPDKADLVNTVTRLTEELRSIPAHDSVLYGGFAGRVEQILSENRSASKTDLAALHLLAAAALERTQCEGDSEVLRRSVGHLDGLWENSGLWDDAGFLDQIRRRKAGLFARFEGELNRDDLARAIVAFEDVLTHPNSFDEQSTLGDFAFRAAVARLRLKVDDTVNPNRRRAEQLLRAARAHYKNAGLEVRSADAASYLAELHLERLRDPNTLADGRAEIFTESWRLLHEAMAATGISDDPLLWARRNELAAELLSERPGVSRPESANEIMQYLDRALNVYQQVADKPMQARCAMRLADAMSYLAEPWNTELIRRFLWYVDIATQASLGEPPQEGARHVLIANSCARALVGGAHGSTRISDRMRALAEQACVLSPSDAAVCAQAEMQIGNSWLNSGNSRPDALVHASEAFERASEHAKVANQTDQETKALRLLGATLGRRFVEGGESALHRRVLETLEKSALHSSGQERAATYLNLASMTLAGIQQGLEMSVDAAQSAAAKAWDVVGDIDPVHARYLESIVSLLDEFAFGIREAMHLTDNLLNVDGHLAPGFARPDVLYFKQYQNEKRTDDSGVTHYVRTLLLFLEEDGRTVGHIALSETKGGVSALFALDCAECGIMQEFALPLIVLFDGDWLTDERLRQQGRAERRCRVCNTSMQIQFAIVARLGAAREMAFIYPDAFSLKGQNIVRQQGGLLTVVYESWIGEALGEVYSFPWSEMEKYQRTEAPVDFERHEHALYVLVKGLLVGDEAALQESLGSESPLLEAESVEQEAVAAVLQKLDSEETESGWRYGTTAKAVNELLALARNKGSEYALSVIRSAWQRWRNGAEEFRAAVAMARNPEERRAFLERFVNETPDYSADREAEIYRIVQFGSELELRRNEAEGLAAREPKRYEHLLAMAQVARQLTEERIEADRQENSAKPAKAIVAEALSGGRRFILLLRSFRVDLISGLGTEIAKSVAREYADPRAAEMQVSHYDFNARSVIERVASGLAEHAGVITVANVCDMLPPPIPKLWVTDLEWRKLAFSLIAEARAIVLILPAEELSSGVSDEIQSILELGRASHTAIVLSDSADYRHLSEGLFVDLTAPTDARELQSRLTEMGFAQVFEQAAFLERPWELVKSIAE